MATSWAEIDAAAMLPIDDIRLQEQFEISPALFYRRMALYVERAIPMLSRPPELLGMLRTSMVKPNFGDTSWISTEQSLIETTTVSTDMIGFDLCSCTINQTLDDGRILQTPYEVNYNAETGEVTFPVQSAAGIVYELDFYTDGSFADLSDAVIQLFASAISVIWDERFIAGWLQKTPKINDSSFITVNEANWTEKTSQAHMRKVQEFHEQLKHYEQLCSYQTRVSNRGVAGVTLV